LIKPHRFLLSRGRFIDKLLRRSVEGITTYYKERGYEDVRVEPVVVDRELKVDVTFQVIEGPPRRWLTISRSKEIQGFPKENSLPKAAFG
jgi:outer membrane protein assembly factor BamA